MATKICVWIGRRIHDLRAQKGWTQQILADHADMNREHLSDLENGKYDPTAATLERLAYALEVRLEEFFRGR